MTDQELEERLARMERMISAIWEIVGGSPNVPQAYWPPGRAAIEAQRQRYQAEAYKQQSQAPPESLNRYWPGKV